MPLVLYSLVVFLCASFAAAALARNPRRAAVAAASLTVIGCIVGVVAAASAFVSGEESALSNAWAVPLASFSIAVDGLSAVFLLVLFAVSGLAAIFGVGYMSGASRRQAITAWTMYPALVGAMALIVIARNGVLFLCAWEAMAVSSYFLVSMNDRSVAVRNAGRVYLIASHLGTACLLAFFLLAGQGAASLDFADLEGAGRAAGISSALFVLALLGFGSKAGLVPMHVWLPDAHSAAPGHVSALMSGVLVKMGVYGLMRSIDILGPPEAWWGWSLAATSSWRAYPAWPRP